MTWQLVFRPEVELDLVEAAEWYELRESGLGVRFLEEVRAVWTSLRSNPFLNSKRHPAKDVRWRYPDAFPYRIVYQILETEKTVLILAVTHAARSHTQWRRRI